MISLKGLPFNEYFSKLYLNMYIRYLNMLLNCCPAIITIVLVIVQTKTFYLLK